MSPFPQSRGEPDLVVDSPQDKIYRNTICAVVFNQEEELDSVVKANFIVVCGASSVFINNERKLLWHI